MRDKCGDSNLKVTTTEKQQCLDCDFWIGRCRRDHKGAVASSESCRDFKPRKTNNVLPTGRMDFLILHVQKLKLHDTARYHVGVSAVEVAAA